MKRIIIDLDGTLTIEDTKVEYLNKKPNLAVIEALLKYKSMGFEIVIHTSRNMRSFQGNLGKINAFTLPDIISWLNKYDIPFDEICIGKPWCGTEGFYVDDKAIRPKEFAELSYEEICEITGQNK